MDFIDDIFDLPPDAAIITGPVGSGKSALAAALTGLYPYQGVDSSRKYGGAPYQGRRRCNHLRPRFPFG